MVSELLDRDSDPGADDSGTGLALAVSSPGTRLNKNPIRIISFRHLLGSPKPAAMAANPISWTALNLPYPRAGSNRHGESIMIDRPHA
jgi:hypothetical protein